MATEVKAPSELGALIDAPLGETPWVVIDQDSIDRFGALTRDEQWIHVDPERAESGPFGATVAHGFLTLSLLSWVLDEILSVGGVSGAVNYGLNRVRFPAPVVVDSRVRGSGRILSVESVTGGTQIIVRIEIEADSASRPVCVADFVIRYFD